MKIDRSLFYGLAQIDSDVADFIFARFLVAEDLELRAESASRTLDPRT